MSTLRIASGVAVAICLNTVVALAQSFNVDTGSSAGKPLNDYGAAAGQPGQWNSLAGGDSDPLELTDINGEETGVTLLSSLPFGQATFDHPATTGGDAALLDDFFDLHSTPATHELAGLLPGHYTLFVYAWAPDDANYRTAVSLLDDPDGAVLVGGDWPGGFAEGITHARFEVDVAAGETLSFRTFGFTKGTLNGFQLVVPEPAGLFTLLLAGVLRRRR